MHAVQVCQLTQLASFSWHQKQAEHPARHCGGRAGRAVGTGGGMQRWRVMEGDTAPGMALLPHRPTSCPLMEGQAAKDASNRQQLRHSPRDRSTLANRSPTRRPALTGLQVAVANWK